MSDFDNELDDYAASKTSDFDGELSKYAASKTPLPEFKQPSQEQSKKGLVNDAIVGIGKGVMQVPGAITGLADIPAGLAGIDRPFDKATNAIGEATGFQPSKWAKEADKAYSPETQAASEAINKVWDDPNTNGLDVAKAYLQNPRAIGKVVTESLPSMAVGNVLGGVARKIGLAKSTAGAAGMGEGAIMAGQQMENTDKSVDAQKAALASTATGVFGGLIGTASGKLANSALGQKIGLSDIDQALISRGEQGLGNAAISTPRRVVAGAVQEGLLEEAPQSAIETISQNYAEDKDLTQGLARNVTEGAIAGAAMGAPMGVFSSGEKPSQDEIPEQPTNEQPTQLGNDQQTTEQARTQPRQTENNYDFGRGAPWEETTFHQEHLNQRPNVSPLTGQELPVESEDSGVLTRAANASGIKGNDATQNESAIESDGQSINNGQSSEADQQEPIAGVNDAGANRNDAASIGEAGNNDTDAPIALDGQTPEQPRTEELKQPIDWKAEARTIRDKINKNPEKYNAIYSIDGQPSRSLGSEISNKIALKALPFDVAEQASLIEMEGYTQPMVIDGYLTQSLKLGDKVLKPIEFNKLPADQKAKKLDEVSRQIEENKQVELSKIDQENPLFSTPVSGTMGTVGQAIADDISKGMAYETALSKHTGQQYDTPRDVDTSAGNARQAGSNEDKAQQLSGSSEQLDDRATSTDGYLQGIQLDNATNKTIGQTDEQNDDKRRNSNTDATSTTVAGEITGYGEDSDQPSVYSEQPSRRSDDESQDVPASNEPPRVGNSTDGAINGQLSDSGESDTGSVQGMAETGSGDGKEPDELGFSEETNDLRSISNDPRSISEESGRIQGKSVESESIGTELESRKLDVQQLLSNDTTGDEQLPNNASRFAGIDDIPFINSRGENDTTGDKKAIGDSSPWESRSAESFLSQKPKYQEIFNNAFENNDSKLVSLIKGKKEFRDEFTARTGINVSDPKEIGGKVSEWIKSNKDKTDMGSIPISKVDASEEEVSPEPLGIQTKDTLRNTENEVDKFQEVPEAKEAELFQEQGTSIEDKASEDINSLRSVKFNPVTFTPAKTDSIYGQGKETTPVKGQQVGSLVVHKDGKEYSISHNATGRAVLSGFKSSESAKLAAARLNNLADTSGVKDLRHEMQNNPAFAVFKKTAIDIKRNKMDPLANINSQANETTPKPSNEFPQAVQNPAEAKQADDKATGEQAAVRLDKLSADKIKAAYAHRTHNVGDRVRLENGWFENAVNDTKSSLDVLAKNDAQKAKVAEIVQKFKEDYVEKRHNTLKVGEGVVSSHIAGRNKFNSKQASKRGDVLDNAESSFNNWVKSAQDEMKREILELRTQEEKKADSKIAEDVRVNKLANEAIVELATIAAIDSGQMPGYDRTSFVGGAYRKIQKLHKNGEAAALSKVFNEIDKYEVSNKKPLFSAKHPVFTLRPVNQNSTTNKDKTISPDTGTSKRVDAETVGASQGQPTVSSEAEEVNNINIPEEYSRYASKIKQSTLSSYVDVNKLQDQKDTNGQPTGWKYVENQSGVSIVNPRTRQVLTYKPEPKSGSDLVRARIVMGNMASDISKSQFKSIPKGELEYKNLYDKESKVDDISSSEQVPKTEPSDEASGNKSGQVLRKNDQDSPVSELESLFKSLGRKNTTEAKVSKTIKDPVIAKRITFIHNNIMNIISLGKSESTDIPYGIGFTQQDPNPNGKVEIKC